MLSSSFIHNGGTLKITLLSFAVITLLSISASPTLFAQAVDSGSGEQDGDSGQVNVGQSIDPQFPLALQQHDGNLYFYLTNCCQQDGPLNNGHPGLLITPDQTPCGPCGGGTSVPGGREIQLPEEFGTNDSGLKLSLTLSRSFDSPRGTIFPRIVKEAPFTDFYGGSHAFNTSVKLDNQQGDSRIFSLVKMKGSGQNAAGEEKPFSIPVLILARDTQDYDYLDNTQVPSQTVRILVRNRLVPQSVVDFDWATSNAEMVTIKLPTPGNVGVLKEVKCLMIHRKN